ncbi:MAG: hypothetical protein B7733_16050 [Myxococcales bacterium FL481]|nr:MAG: hypothetical protein B7733_16050 [Myxococcales bacterium FL481]
MAQRPPGAVADLAFPRRGVDDLLAFAPEREDLDLDHETYGHCRLDQLTLVDAMGGQVELPVPLIVGLHGADDQPPGLTDDIVLEFCSPRASDPVFHALLSRFLEVHLASALGNEHDVVLAVCNPNAARLARPTSLGPRAMHYAEGPVDAWRVETDGLPSGVRLHARRWHTVRADEAT